MKQKQTRMVFQVNEKGSKKKQTFKKEARQRLAAALFKVETEGIKSGFKDDS